MSYLVFLGGVFFLVFGLGITYYADFAFGYEEYPQIRAHFPVWNVRALFVLGIAVTVLSFVAFLIDHQSWRVGFFVLSFLLLVVLVLLVNFTGYAYRNSRQTYEYYKGVTDAQVAHDRLYYVHVDAIQGYGCPVKYLPATTCGVADQVSQWETAATAPATLYCVNTACAGLNGQLYSDTLLNLSNFGLLATIAGCIVSIGCYYFWYVSWVDTARDKKKDFIWLVIKALAIITFLVVFFAVDKTYVNEMLDKNGNHY